MPISDLLPHPWYETPNIHLCTIRDFVALCDEVGVTVERSVTLDRHGRPYSLDPHGALANLLAEQGVFVLSGATVGPRRAWQPELSPRHAVRGRRRCVDEAPAR